MTEKTSPPSTPKPRFMTPYVMIWAGLASLSLVYLGLLALKPAMVAEVLGARPIVSADATSERDRTFEAALADVRAMKSTVDQLRDEVTSIKSEVSASADRDRDVMERIAALEAAPAPGGKPAKVAAVQPPAKPQTPAAAAPAAAGNPAAAQKKPAPATAPTQTANAPAQGAGLETGSVAGAAATAPAVTFGPATVTPSAVTPPATGKAVGVILATGPSIDSLRLSWTLLAERHGARIGGLQPRYTVGADEQGVAYNLVAGPVNSLAEAKQICQELAAKATPCTPAQFRGDAL